MDPIVTTAAGFTDYINQDLLVLIPVLMLVGKCLKSLCRIDNKWIPLILGLAGIGLAILNVFSSSTITGWSDAMYLGFTGVVQGILCSGSAVYLHQLVKNSQKKPPDDDGGVSCGDDEK